MSTATPNRRPGDDLVDRFQAARGVKADGDWAAAAILRFVLDNVRLEVAVSVLEEALAAVEGSGTGPEELFGPADDWARERQAEVAAIGGRLVDTDPALTWRDLPAGTAVAAGLFSVPVALVRGVGEGWTQTFSASALALPLVLAFLVMVCGTLWTTQIARHTMARTLAVFVPVMLVLTVGAGTALPALAQVPVFTGSALWWLAVVAAYLGLGVGGAALMGRSAPPEEPRQPGPVVAASPEPPDDDAWALVLAGILRSRLAFSDARAREVVDEARAHAAEAGRPLAEEFGTAQEYASRFRPDRRRALRWEAILATAVAVAWVGSLWAGLAARDVSWWTVAGAVLFPLVAWRLWQRHARQA